VGSAGQRSEKEPAQGASERGRRFLLRDARWLSGGFLLFFLSSFGQTFFFSLSGEGIRTEHGLSHGEFGGLYLAATVTGALLLARAGRAVDRYSARTIVLVAVPALGAGAMVMAVSEDVLVLGAAMFLLRFLGQGMLTHTSFTLMGRWFTRQRGRAVSIAALGLNAGEALLPVAVIAVTGAFGWRTVWGSAAVLLLFAVVALALLFARERTPEADAEHPVGTTVPGWTRREALRDPYFPLVVLALSAPPFIGNTVFFNQLHLADVRGWDPDVVASSFTVYAVATVACNVIGGHLVDRVSALRVVPIFLLPLSGGLLVLAAVAAPWAAFVFMALYGISNGLSFSVLGATMPEIYGVQHLAAIRSVVVSILVLASAVGPGVSGMLIDTGVAYQAQLAGLGAYCLAVSLLMAVFAPRIRARGIRRRRPAAHETGEG
jgi:MFS family permease